MWAVCCGKKQKQPKKTKHLGDLLENQSPTNQHVILDTIPNSTKENAEKLFSKSIFNVNIMPSAGLQSHRGHRGSVPFLDNQVNLKLLHCIYT